MLTSEFTSFPLSAIIVDREARQRRELVGIPELAWSLQTHGLINPIVIDREGKLVAGESRLEAARSLGWDHIAVQFVEDLSPEERIVLELEENIRRNPLEWKDECAAVAAYHATKLKQHPDWTAAKTAKELHMSESSISDKLAIATELAKGNKLVEDASAMSKARNIVTRQKERWASTQIQAILQTRPKQIIPLINADFHEWIDGWVGDKFNFLHCDFPYGVNADKHATGAAEVMGGYEDTIEVYERLIDTLGRATKTIVANSAHLMFWFSMDYYNFTYEALTAMGWKVNRFPLIWLKSDNAGILPDPARGPRRIYETCFIGSRGDRKIVQAVANAFACPTTKKIHMSEKPKPMLHHFMRMFVDESTIGLDPTCGSGNAVKVMQEKRAAQVFGVEKDPGFYELACRAWNDV